MRFNISYGFADNCCEGCANRCVEPLCRTHCAEWQRHEAEKRRVYALRSINRDVDMVLADSVERSIGRKLYMR